MRCAMSGSTTRSRGRWAGQMSSASMPGLTPAPWEGQAVERAVVNTHGTAWHGMVWRWCGALRC